MYKISALDCTFHMFDVFINCFLHRLKLGGFVRKSSCAIVLWTELLTFFIEQHIFTWSMVIQAWVFGEHFLKKERSVTVITRKTTNSDKIWAFTYQVEFWKTCLSHCELECFPVPKKIFDEMGSDINKCDFLILHNSVNWYFPNNLCLSKRYFQSSR